MLVAIPYMFAHGSRSLKRRHDPEATAMQIGL